LIALPHSQLLEISGSDAANFAQAQFSSDAQALAPGHWQWSAWLSPQGRVRYFFALLRETPERLLLVLRGGEAERLREELMRFVFRAKVKLLVRADLGVFGCDEATVVAQFGARPESDTLASAGTSLSFALSGARWLLLKPIAAVAVAVHDERASSAWRLADIHAGLPELSAALTDRLLPQWLGLDRLHAVSVAKGCYPGQEIMARLHFKGGNKRGLYRIGFACDVLPAAGTPIAVAGTEIGVVVDSVWTSGTRAEALASLADSAAAASTLGDSGPLHDIQVISRFG
jgi:tRNA-modifying protein YgfZ